MQLFHFTRRDYLPSILCHGLDEGEIALTPSVSTQGICLTEIQSPTAQKAWVRHVIEKVQIRLVLDLDRHDERLIQWKYVPQRVKMERRVWKALTITGGGDPYKWWVYFGVIPSERIVEVIDVPTGRALTVQALEAIKREPHERGINPQRIKWISFQEALLPSPNP